MRSCINTFKEHSVFPVFLILLVLPLASQSQVWQKEYNEALDAYDQGDLETTVNGAKKALELSESDTERLFTLKLLSSVSNEIGDFDQGILYGHLEVELVQSMELPDSVQYNSFRTLSLNYLESGNYAKAKGYLRQSSLLAFNHYGESSYEYNEVLSYLGLSYHMVNQQDSAIICLQAANKELLNIPEGAFDFLNNSSTISYIYFQTGDHINASKSYEELKSTLEINDLTNDELYAEVSGNLGLTYYELGSYDKSVAAISTSIEVQNEGNFLLDQYPQYVNTLSLSYLKLGDSKKADSISSSLDPSQTSRNVYINQLNLATSQFLEGNLETAKSTANKVASEAASEADLSCQAKLLLTKIELRESGKADYSELNHCVSVFTNNQNYEKLADSYLTISKVQFQSDNQEARNSIQMAVDVLDKGSVTNNLAIQIHRQYFLVNISYGALQTAIEHYGLLASEVRTKLALDFAVLLESVGEDANSVKILSEVSENEMEMNLEFYLAFTELLLRQSSMIRAKHELDKLNNWPSEVSSIVKAQILSLNAKLAQFEGSYGLAELSISKSLDLLSGIDKNEISTNESVAAIYNSSGIFYQTIGNYARALELYDEGFELVPSESRIGVDIRQNKATLLQLQGYYEESIPILTELLTSYEKINGKSHPSYGVASQNLATAYQKTGDLNWSLRLLKEAIAIDETNNLTGSISYLNKLHNLGVTYLEIGLYDDAIKSFEKVVESRKLILGENHPDYAFSVYNYALALQNAGLIEESKDAFDLMLVKYEKLVKEFYPYLSEKEKYAFSGKIKTAFVAWQDFTTEYALSFPDAIEDLVNFELEFKAALLNSSIDLRKQVEKTNDSEILRKYDRWIALKRQTSNLLTLSVDEMEGTGSDIVSIQNEANELEKELSLSLSSLSDSEKTNISDVQEVLRSDEVAIDIFRIRKNIKNDSIWYVAVVIKPEDEPQMHVFENGIELDGRMFNYYRNSVNFKIQDTITYHQFWQPIDALTMGFNKVYVSPDGIYNKLSINSLYNPVTKQYLIETSNIQLISNLKDLINRENTEIDVGAVSLFGDPTYYLGDKNISDYRMINPLPGTAEEVLNIGKLIEEKGSRSRTFIKESASEKNLKDLSQPSILHIATHGFFLEDPDLKSDLYSIERNPLLRSGLLLAGSQDAFMGDRIIPNQAIDGEDGILTAFEIMNLDLSNTEMVILSACETGLGELNNGEGVYGLQRAIFLAGAKSVIMSLWKVDDQATMELMVTFYENLISGMDKQKALVEAQRTISARYPDPYYWGAFIIAGI